MALNGGVTEPPDNLSALKSQIRPLMDDAGQPRRAARRRMTKRVRIGMGRQRSGRAVPSENRARSGSLSRYPGSPVS